MANVLKRAAFVRHQLQQQDMPVDDQPDDDETRETYNFAPGYHGLVYRADVPDYGSRRPEEDDQGPDSNDGRNINSTPMESSAETKYKLQAMKWGMIITLSEVPSSLRRACPVLDKT